MNIDLTIKELYRMFNFFNKEFYNETLEQPILLIQTNGKHKNTYGWCTSKKIWNDCDGNESYYEITICAEYLNRPIKEIVGTLLHEMVHLYNLQNNIKDVSRGGTYHNKRFKSVAEGKGLIIEYDKRIGWSLTTLQENTENMINILNPSVNLFKIARRGPYIPTNDDNQSADSEIKSKSSMRKYVCPCCGIIVRATKDVNIICGDCKEILLKEEKE